MSIEVFACFLIKKGHPRHRNASSGEDGLQGNPTYLNSGTLKKGITGIMSILSLKTWEINF
jgi:hypothetical protein